MKRSAKEDRRKWLKERATTAKKRPMRTVETRSSLVRAIVSTYEGFECAVIADGCEASDWFKIKLGV